MSVQPGEEGMSAERVLRIHPTINFARLGTSPEFYLSPETSAGVELPGTATTGGLPIKAGTESTSIDSADLRDATGRLKRQAARFRLFAYRFDGTDTYPSGDGVEVLPGAVLDGGRKVATVVWTVHLANRKAAAYVVVPSQGRGGIAHASAYPKSFPTGRLFQPAGPLDTLGRSKSTRRVASSSYPPSGGPRLSTRSTATRCRLPAI